MQSCESGLVAHDVGLAGKREGAARVAQVFAESDFAYRQRHAVPCRAVARDVASGVERHARRSTYAGLHECVREADAAAGETFEVSGCEIRMTVAAEVVGAQLVTHDEEDVADGAHRKLFADLRAGRRMSLIYTTDKPSPCRTSSTESPSSSAPGRARTSRGGSQCPSAGKASAERFSPRSRRWSWQPRSSR